MHHKINPDILRPFKKPVDEDAPSDRYFFWGTYSKLESSIKRWGRASVYLSGKRLSDFKGTSDRFIRYRAVRALCLCLRFDSVLDYSSARNSMDIVIFVYHVSLSKENCTIPSYSYARHIIYWLKWFYFQYIILHLRIEVFEKANFREKWASTILQFLVYRIMHCFTGRFKHAETTVLTLSIWC